MQREQRLKANLEAVEGRLADACAAAGRARADVRLVAVTKYVDAEVVSALAALGVTDCGENRPQQLWAKAEAVPQVRWHLVGHLQRNKVERTLPSVALIHSADSVRLLEALEAEARKRGEPVRTLVEVHLTDETTKQGFEERELEPLGEALARLPHVEILGLMTMAAFGSSRTEARRTFFRLREWRERLKARWPQGGKLTELSMGMSDDFPDAIAEGATLVRIGSALFEGLREPPPPRGEP